MVDVWEDTRIRPGDEWRAEIRKAIEAASVAVLLISADFLASEFVASEELPALVEAAERRGLRVLQVIVSPSRFERTPLAPEPVRFREANRNRNSVCSSSRRNEVGPGNGARHHVAHAPEVDLRSLPRATMEACPSA